MVEAIQCLCHFPIGLNLSPPPQQSKAQFHSFPQPTTIQKPRSQTVLRRSSYNRDGVEKPVQESAFLDENGVVEDMDGYLNYLSLEYDSVWDTKPSWCQPWTITLTGIGIITCSWLILHSVPVTSFVAALICAWWYIFLYSYPKAYTDMIAERREKVTSGQEDTYGRKTDG